MANQWGWLLAVGLWGLSSAAMTETPLAIALQVAQADHRSSHKREADRLFQQGIEQYQTSQLQEALRSWRSALQIYQMIRDHQGEASSLGNLGNVYYSLGQYQRALNLHDQALAIQREIGDQGGEASSLGNLGNVYYSLGQYQQAISLHEQALVIQRRIGDREGEAISLGNLGNDYYSLGQYQQAISLHEQALTIQREIGAQGGEGISLGNLGNVYYSLGQYQKTINFHTQALEIQRRVGNRQGEASSLGNLGNAYYSLGQYQQAISLHEQALTIQREIGDQGGEASSLGNLGNVYYSLGQYQRTIEFHNQVIAIQRRIGDRQGEASSLGSLGNTYYSLGQYQQAISLHEQALTIQREIGDQGGEGISLGNLGNVYYSLEQHQQAIEFHNQVIAIQRRIGDRQGESSSLGNLGNVYYSLGQHQQAISLHEQTLAIQREIGDQGGEGISLGNLGNAYYSLGQHQQAIKFYQQALSLVQVVQSRDTEKTILGNLGKTFQEQGQTEAAIAFYKQSINVTESIRQNIRGLDRTLQQSYTDSVANTYRNLANLLLTEGRLLEAQEVLDLLTLQEIREYNRGTRATINAQGKVEYTSLESQIIQEHGSLIAFDQKVLDCEKTNCADKARLVQQRDALNQEFLQTIKKAQLDSQARQRNDESTENPTLLARKAAPIVQQQPGTILIQTFVQREKETDNKKGKLWLLWVAGNAAGKVDREIDSLDFANTVRDFRDALSRPDGDPAKIRQLGRKLYDWLIKPLESELQQNQIQHLIFRLDRELRYIPIAALHDGNQFLIERYTIANILTIATTNTTDRRSPTPEGDRILALGKTEDYGDFGPLPHVKDEIAAIVRNSAQGNGGLYPGDGYLDRQFTLDALQQNLYGRRLLHIATHGKFSPAGITESYLLLGDNGRLAMSDIQSLSHLDGLHLAVLSACQTGLSGDPVGDYRDRSDGREINSLTHAFTAEGGAKAILASLWNVNDRSTSLLMREFYRRLAADPKLTKAEALRQSQIAFLKGELTRSGDVDNPAHPFYWSPFVLTGNSW